MDDEIATLILSSIACLLCATHWKSIVKIKAQLLAYALFFFSAACVCTVAEGFIYCHVFNYAEHTLYIGTAACTFIWFYRFAKYKQTHTF